MTEATTTTAADGASDQKTTAEQIGTRARMLGPDIVRLDFNGWWVYIIGPIAGAAIAVMLIGLVRGRPNKEEREAAKGGALSIERKLYDRQANPGVCQSPGMDEEKSIP